MAITATDTGNQFAGEWKSAEAAVTGGALLPAGASAADTEYNTAWNNERAGVYGALDKGTPTPVPTPGAAAAAPEKSWKQQLGWEDAGGPGGRLMLTTDPAYNKNLGGLNATGGYGTFNYGDALPARGTEQWSDMSEYLAMGGQDPTGYLKDAAFQTSWDNAPQRSYTGYENGQYGT